MKETTPAAMPPCFDKWCSRFDDLLRTKAQKREFRHYLGGLLGESERKNLSQMAEDAVGVKYHQLHHFATVATWSPAEMNERRLQVMNQCSQTRISRGFSLIIDDSGHRKSGNFTYGVGRQYIGEIGKTDNGNVVVTSHLYDGKKSLPIDIELYQHSSSLADGKEDNAFHKKPDIALSLVERTLKRGYRPGIVIMDAGYGNNTSLLNQLEKHNLTYLGGLAKNRKVIRAKAAGTTKETRLDELALSLPAEEFRAVEISVNKPRTVWVALVEVEISKLSGQKKIAIVMNAPTAQSAQDIDYLITNYESSNVTEQWIVNTYSQRNWVEVFYREAKGWLGLREYQVRDKNSLMKHFILVFCAYTFILWHQLTGGLRRRWASKSLETFPEALKAFRTAISYRFVTWLRDFGDVFKAYKKSLGLIWA